MSDRFALVLALLIAALIGADIFLNDGAYLQFLARKGLEVIAWIAFWR